MSGTTSARGYDWTGVRAVDLYRWASEDLETARILNACNRNSAAVSEHIARASAKLAALRAKIAGTWVCPCGHEQLLENRLVFGVPDSQRVYWLGYLARHPEIQEGEGV